jgi:alpha-1,2-mannosyltransferase
VSSTMLGANARWTLLRLWLANLLLAVVLLALKPSVSQLNTLLSIFHGEIREDSSSYMDAAWDVAHRHGAVYTVAVSDVHRKFIYPTSSLLLVFVAHGMHATLHSLLVAIVIASSLLTLWFSAEVFLLLLPGEFAQQAQVRWQVRGLVAGLGLLFYPLVNAANLGQVQALLTFLFTLGVWLWLKDRKALAGVALAIACAFKPPLALFLIWGLLRKEWRFLGALLSVAAALQLLAVFCFGLRYKLDYVAALRYLSRHGESIAENQSVNGFLQRLTSNGVALIGLPYFMYPPYNAIVYWGTLLSTAALLIVALAVPMWRRWAGTAADFVLFGLVSTIASPIVWTHHYGVFFVGSLFVLALFLRQTGRMPASFLVCYLLLASFIQLLGRYANVASVNWILSYTLYAGLGMSALLAFSIRHDASPGKLRTEAH